MTPSEASALLASLKAAYPRQTIGQETIVIYAGDLRDLDYQHARKAVTKLRQSSRWFPTIAEIREAAAEFQLGAPRAMEAWRQASQRGDRHPLVDQARLLVGDDWHWRTAEATQLLRTFEKAYAEVRTAALEELVAPSVDFDELEGGTLPELTS